MDDKIKIFTIEQHEGRGFLGQIVDIHIACIQRDFLIATFMPPLNYDKMLNYWRDQSHDPSRTIFMQFAKQPDGSNAVLGCVVLRRHLGSETGPFRADVEKLLVSPEYRYKGIAKRMMARLEEVARAEGRTMLMLDTVQEGDAVGLYPKLGFIQCGIIPEYCISVRDGSRVGEVFFYKNLERSALLL